MTSKNPFDIIKYKNKSEIISIVTDLGNMPLTKTSHDFKELVPIKIIDAAKMTSENYLKYGKERPALAIIEVILAAHRDFANAVKPHINRLEQEGLTSLDELSEILNSKTRNEFFDYWGHHDNKKYETLTEVLKRIQLLKISNPEIKGDYAILNHWAKTANLKLKEDVIGSIENIGVATFQHLRMSFGVDTVKPDQRVKEVLRYEFEINKLADLSAILAVEQIAEIMNMRVLMIDQIFVKYGSGYYNRTSANLEFKVVSRKLKNLGVDASIISEATGLSLHQIDLL
jgi:hypothetical protein